MINNTPPIIINSDISVEDTYTDGLDGPNSRIRWQPTYVGMILHDEFGGEWSNTSYPWRVGNVDARMFSPMLIKAILNKTPRDELLTLANKLFPGDYNSSIVECSVVWLDCLHSYIMDAYDGYERVRVLPHVLPLGMIYYGDDDTHLLSSQILGNAND